MSSLRASVAPALFFVGACGGPPPAVPPSSSTSELGRPAAPVAGPDAGVGQARLFPPSARSDVTAEQLDPDGSRRFVAHGLRMIERPDGSLEAADLWLPTARNIKAFSLPRRLGGGFLFVVQSGGSTLLYAAPSWTGALRPVARIEAEVEQVVPGFDRLYLAVARASQWMAIDPGSGLGVDLGSLPPSAGYGQMAFADEWFGVALTPFRGALATFDAGGTWHALGMPVTAVAPLDDGVLLVTPSERFALQPSGALVPIEPEDAARPRGRAKDARHVQDLPAETLRPLGPRPLETTVLHGFPEPGGTALVAALGTLVRARLRDGAVMARVPDAYAGAAPCDAVPLGAGAGFVCGEAGAGTAIYAVATPLGLRPVAAFEEPRRVAPSGNGMLVVSGGCDAKSTASDVYCVVGAAGVTREVRAPERGVRVVALADGGVVRLVPPRLGSAGALVLVPATGAERRVPLVLPKRAERAALGLLGDGLWLDSFEQAAGGELRGWVAGAGSFVGVRVKLDGKVEVGGPQQYLDRALLSSSFGLVVGRGGAALESVDGGFEWNDVELPAEPEFKLARTMGKPQGCTRIGCAFSGWLRVGWSRGENRLSTVASPERATPKLPSGNRWSLECVANAEVSRPALALEPERSERGQTPWNPLAELAPPVRAASDRALDSGSEPEIRGYRAYAWGPPLDGWQRSARWLVRVVDPHALVDGVWSTAPTPVPWASPELTQDVFGQSPSGPPASLRLVADPNGRAALLVVNLRGATELFLLEEGRAIVRLKTSGALGAVSGLARAGSRLYVSALGEAQTLRVYRIESGTLALLGEYADVVARAELPALAPASRGDGLALWVRAGNYYLYPLEPTTGKLDAPVEVSAETLGIMPRACSANEDGYVVGDALTLAPRIDLYDANTKVGNGIDVRLIVSASNLCVDGIVAPVSGSIARSRPPPTPRARSGVRLILSDPQPGGSRRSFRCWD